MTLTIGQLTTALDVHGVSHHTDGRGRVWAEEVATVRTPVGTVRADAWVLVSADRSELYAWLGY